MATTRRALITGLVASAGATAGGLGGQVAIAPPAAAAAPTDAVNVRDHGALGNGRTDDTRAIQEAMGTAIGRTAERRSSGIATNGGSVFFPSGTYVTSAGLSIPQSVTLVGENQASTQIKYTGPSLSGALLTFGRPGSINTSTGLRNVSIDAGGRAAIGLLLYGPQEGSSIVDVLVAGARSIAVDVRSKGVVGGSNKFVIERSWLWTSGDEGIAGLRLDAQSGPVSIRDTSLIGTNRTTSPKAGSAGIVASRSTVLAENVNVEHFDTFCYLDRSHAELHTITSFFTKYGVVTTKASTDASLVITNASFDRVKQSVVDRGAGVTIAYCRGYTSDSYRQAARQLQHNQWALGSSKVYQSESAQGAVGFTLDGTADVDRFKLSRLSHGRWVESAAVDANGVFGSAGSAFDSPHLRLGRYHLWVDRSGRLRMKEGAPSYDGDGKAISD